jgi:hypothetical protein
MISGHLIWVSNGKDEPLFIAALPNPGDRPVFRLGFGKRLLDGIVGGQRGSICVVAVSRREGARSSRKRTPAGRTDFDFPSSILFFRSEHLQQKCYFCLSNGLFQKDHSSYWISHPNRLFILLFPNSDSYFHLSPSTFNDTWVPHVITLFFSLSSNPLIPHPQHTVRCETERVIGTELMRGAFYLFRVCATSASGGKWNAGHVAH